jgi:hypothetical protein
MPCPSTAFSADIALGNSQLFIFDIARHLIVSIRSSSGRDGAELVGGGDKITWLKSNGTSR